MNAVGLPARIKSLDRNEHSILSHSTDFSRNSSPIEMNKQRVKYSGVRCGSFSDQLLTTEQRSLEADHQQCSRRLANHRPVGTAIRRNGKSGTEICGRPLNTSIMCTVLACSNGKHGDKIGFSEKFAK
ncbi:hypothetical protein BaRGS_00007127 [Batillaria attramentaria]|uniref:Uncharacterized protein n=1 Tax=Batillaria attramentaria TaxID=370345 RepID=A0ABD0LRB2_9CAEN